MDALVLLEGTPPEPELAAREVDGALALEARDVAPDPLWVRLVDDTASDDEEAPLDDVREVEPAEALLVDEVGVTPLSGRSPRVQSLRSPQ